MGINFQIYEIRRGHPFRNQVLISLHDSLVQIRASEIPSVHEEILVPEALFRLVRPADISCQLHDRGLCADVHHFPCHTGAKQILYPVFQRHGSFEHINVLAVVGQGECDIRSRQGNMVEFGNDMLQLDIRRLDELPPCRHIIEQIPYREIRPLGCSHHFRGTVYRIGETDLTAHFVLLSPGLQSHFRHGRYRRKSLSPEAESMYVHQIFSRGDLGCRVPFEA